MIITKQLDTDKDLEFLESGTMCHASNIVVNNTNIGILSEHAIEKKIELNENETIVGHIEASDEFIIFTNNNRIIRIKTSDYSQEVIQSNWKWQGGKVIGCYTYNANQEMIIAISEQLDYDNKKVPLKIINLNKPNYKEDDSDDKYTLAPEIPISNLVSYEYINGNNIYKGVYVFFIRYKLDSNYTSWFKLGYPINIYNTNNKETIVEGKFGYILRKESASGANITDTETVGTYGFSEQCDDDSTNISKNIRLNIDVQLRNINYDKYQIGYIVTDVQNATHVFTTIDYDINNKFVIIDNKNNDEISLDEITRDAFQIFNAKTLCNYNNRIYLANYNEENLNAEVPNIDVSGITVNAVSYEAKNIENNNLNTKIVKQNITLFTKQVKEKTNTIASNKISNPINFNVGKGYYVELYFNWKDNENSYPLNIKLFCTRICTISNTNCLMIKVADILHAASSYLTKNTYNTNITFNTTYNPEVFNEVKFIAIKPNGNKYDIKFISDDQNYYYDKNTDIYNVETIIYNHSTIDVTKPNIGQKTDIRSTKYTKTALKADIEYLVSETTNSNDDLFITNIIQFDTTNEGLNAIEADWFYNGKFILDDVEYKTKGAYSNNYINLDLYQTAYPIIKDNTIINYKARKAFNFNILDDREIIYNKIKEVFPATSYEFLYYCINEDETESDYEINADIDSKYIKAELNLGYDKVNKEYKLIKIEWNDTNPISIQILKNDFYVIDSEGEKTKHNISEVFASIEFSDYRINDTIDDLINYWNGGGDQGYVNTYKWTEDREPTEEEWNINEEYNIEWGKLVYDNTVEEGYNDITKRLYNKQAIAVGYQNIVENEETHVITVDKDFAIPISIYDICNQLYDDNIVYPSELSTVLLCSINDSTIIKSGIFKNFYVLFRKQDVIDYANTQVINGLVCYLNEDTPIDSTVPIFEKLYDFTFNLDTVENKYNFPGFRSEGSSTIWLKNALFYINKVTQGEFDLEDNIANSEYKKTAISNAIYNFFIHFVYANGNYTAGIRIQNNRTYNLTLPVATCKISQADGSQSEETFSYECNEETTINIVKTAFNDWVEKNKATIVYYDNTYKVYKFFDCQDNLRICNIYPVFDDTGISVYINSKGEKLFRGYPKDESKLPYLNYNSPIKFRFDNIPHPEGFVGYFISYEKPEHILIGSGVVTPYNNEVEEDFNGTYNGTFNRLRFYYPEFNVSKKANGINVIITRDNPIGGEAQFGDMFKDFYDIKANKINYTYNNSSDIAGIDTSNIIIPNDASNENGGREGILRLTLKEAIKVLGIKENGPHYDDNYAYMYLTQAIGLSITDNIYLNENKELISLGLIKYYYDDIENNQYGYEDYPYDYDYYKCNGSLYAFNKRGVVYDEVESIPKFFDDNSLVYPNYPIVKPNIGNYDWRTGNTPICRYNYDLFCEIDLNAKQIDNAPIEHYYTLKKDDDDDATNNEDIVNVRTVYVYPLYINDLFKIASCYSTYSNKIMINYNDELYYNFITYYGRTIRRSDVMSDESIENKWRIFRAEEYKIINENKGNIINVVGIGIYLIAHCEHSLFIFNRDNTMRTEDKDVQLTIPDAFEIDYSEVFTSDKGYAGIQKFNQWCISNYGYIFFDNDSKKLYQFDNNSLNDLTLGMINLFNNVENIKFAIDSDDYRLICIGTINNNTDDNKFTISYSFLAKNWISTHSYWYDDLFNTKEKIFFILNSDISSIHTFSDKFNKYSNLITDETNVFKTELIEDNPSSFIDVIFNNNGIDKVLNYISYRINKATDDTYSGNKMLIYTNVCYSDYMDISKPRKSVKDYKNPVFRFGIWVYNWFRNKILKIDTINPIIRGNGKFALTEDELGKGVDNALIVGKYFAIRIIFRDEDKRISVDDIQCY